jgi:SPP1 gp7 family putative phage head morphogenesis protein
MTVNQRLFDYEVAHQIALSRYSTQTVRKIVALLNRIDADLTEELQRVSFEDVTQRAAKERRLEKMLEAVRVAHRAAYGAAHKTLKRDLEELSEYESETQARNILRAAKGMIDADRLKLPKPEDLYAAVNARPFQGKLLKEWLSEADAASVRRVREIVRQGYVEGLSVDEMVNRIRGTRAFNYQDGVLEISRRGAEAMVRTAVSHTASAAKTEFMRRNSDVVGSWMFSAVLDSRTTLICMGLSGKIFPIGEGPMPPRHINCRSVMVPVLKTGGPPEEKSYAAWLREQDRETVEDALGRSRAKLFLDGEMAIDRFTTKGGSPLTLDQLRKREAKAFKRAGL